MLYFNGFVYTVPGLFYVLMVGFVSTLDLCHYLSNIQFDKLVLLDFFRR